MTTMNVLISRKPAEQNAATQKKRELLESIGLTSMANNFEEEIDGFPVLPHQMFLDIQTVFPTVYPFYPNEQRHEMGWRRAEMVFGDASFQDHHKDWASYQFCDIPDEVLAILKAACENKLFWAVEIRTPEYKRQAAVGDPFLLGCLFGGRRVLLAQWGAEELLFFPQISEIAELRRKTDPACFAGSKFKKLRKRFPHYAKYLVPTTAA